jgi:hypothetical protein
MIKKIAATAALAFVATAGAHAQTTPTLTAGQYSGTLQFTASYDPFSICSGAGIVVGGTQTSTGSFALGRAPAVTTAVVDTTNDTGVAAQTCIYAKLPTALSATGTTSVAGTTTCTSTDTTKPKFQILTGGTFSYGSLTNVTSLATVNSVGTNLFKVTTTNAQVQAIVPPATKFSTVCVISTDALYLRTGK